MYSAEGTIEIELSLVWEFILQFCPSKDSVVLGVPRFNQDNGVMEVDYAADSDGDPTQWAVKPKALLQWDNYEYPKETL